LTSKIINMVERMKDAEDRLLESMFESAAIADNGFSARIVKKINRRLWLRRLVLPVAVLVGGAIAYKPLAALVALGAEFATFVPLETLTRASSSIPQFPSVILGAILLVAGLFGLRMIED